MYDTVNITLSNKSLDNINIVDYIGDKLYKPSYHTFSNNSTSVTGYLKNLKITASPNNLKIINSIAKFKFDHNFKDLSLNDTREIYEEISDLLCLPIDKATVNRIDFGSNFQLNYDLSVFFNRLLNLKGFQRLEQSKGLYYNNSINQKTNSVQLAFYNKYADYKDKGIKIPDEYNHQHTLRYELRYINRLPKSLNQKKIIVSDLYKPEFFNNLLNNWLSYYNQIIKKTDTDKIDFSRIKSTKDIDNIALMQLIERNGGTNEVIKSLKEAAKINKYNRKAFYNLKQKINKANQYAAINFDSDYHKELDIAINNHFNKLNSTIFMN